MSDVDHGTAPASAGSGLGPDERAERARRKHGYFSWRPTVATILVVIGCLLAPVSVLVIELIELIGARLPTPPAPPSPPAPPAQPGMAGGL